jgi:thiamine kinase-like enzyme
MGVSYVEGVERLDRILTRLQAIVGPLSGEPVALSGGITNHNFRVTLGGEDYVLRIHGKDTKLLGIDRRSERLASELAAGLGIAPALVAAFDDCLLTRFVACDAAGPAEVADSVELLALALRALHRAPAALPSRFWVPDLLERYRALVRGRRVKLPKEYGQAAAIAAEIAAAVPLRDPRPCHNDLLAGNIIRTLDGRVLIVDWEYAGMGHPYFDLGNLSVNNEFSEAHDERLLRAYHGHPPTDAQRATLALMRILSDAREAAWGVVQAQVSELEFDFPRYARTHFERMLAASAQPQLREALAAARAGSGGGGGGESEGERAGGAGRVSGEEPGGQAA